MSAPEARPARCAPCPPIRTDTPYRWAVSFYPNLGYNPDTDFEPIGVVVYQPLVIITRKDFPAADIKEFVSYVKANSEKLNLAHTGVGSITYTNALLLNATLGTKPTLVPFGSNASTDSRNTEGTAEVSSE